VTGANKVSKTSHYTFLGKAPKPTPTPPKKPAKGKPAEEDEGETTDTP
jgi:hypothetical protein